MSQSFTIPTIETERLILRGFEERDLHAISSIYSNEDTARFVGGVLPEYGAWRLMATILGHWALRGFGLFCVEEKATGQSIGFCGPWYPNGFPEQEIGYALTSSAHGKGFAFEAARASLLYAYQTLKWTTAVSFIHADNNGSQKLAKKLGAFKEQEAVSFNQHTNDIWRHLSPKEFLARHA